MKIKEKILLIGGGGHCHSVIDVIEKEDKFSIAGIIDRKELVGTKVLDYLIIGSDDDLVELFKVYKYAIVTVGQIKSNTIRVKLFQLLKEIGYTLPTIVSPTAYISKYAAIDDGTVVHHQAIINANAKVGQNCIINTKALIEHDVVIEDSCHISTASIINGGTVVKKDTFVGSNSVTKEYITIQAGSFIKAGSVVV